MLVLLLLVTWCELLLPDPFFEPLDLPVELPAFALVVEPPVVPAVPAVPALVEPDASALAAWRSSTSAWISFALPLLFRAPGADADCGRGRNERERHGKAESESPRSRPPHRARDGRHALRAGA